MVQIAPSIVSAPLTNLQEIVAVLEDSQVDMIHFDLEDGCFVPVMNLGTRVIQDLRPLTKLPFDVHLMMLNPEWIIPDLAKHGVNRTSVHYEACPYPRRTLGIIAQYGMQAGLAFNPKTSLPPLQFCRPFLSFVVILTTEPETGEAKYLPSVLGKIAAGKSQPGLDELEWVVDGGITAENVNEVVEAGADIVVSGRGIFQGRSVQENVRRMKAVAGQSGVR
jgi:ribulose-phosphate 3-epimerase